MVLVRGGIPVKPHVQRCADAVVEEFGEGLSPGTYNGHSPPEGPTQALDLFNSETSTGWDLQRRVADWLITNAKKYGVRYVIKWNPNGADWIWNIERAAEGWRAMATRDHRDHVHVTFYAKAEIVTEPTPRKDDDDMLPIFGDAPDGRDGGLWMIWGGFKKRVHTTEVWSDYERLGAKHIGDVDKGSKGKFRLAMFDGAVDVDTLMRKG